MAERLTVGERLLELKSHSGLSLAAIARAAGYRAASSIQKLFNADYDPPALSAPVVERLKAALVGAGSPPIHAAELDVLGQIGNHEKASTFNPTRVHRILSSTIEVFATEETNDDIVDMNGYSVSTFKFLRHDGERYVCPPHLRPDWIWAFYVSTTTMSPRYEVGELLFYQLRPPPKIGDDVIVEFAHSNDSAHRYTLGRLAGFDAHTIMLGQIESKATRLLPRLPTVRPMRILRHSDFVIQKAPNVR